MSIAKTFLAIGVAIIFSIFISFGLSVVYEAPEREFNPFGDDECSKTYDCQKQIKDCQEQYEPSTSEYRNCYSTVRQTAEYKSCDKLLDECREIAQKQTPRYKHTRNSFYILMVIGILSIILGSFIISLEGIGSGLIGGGVLITIISLFSTYEYWFTLNKYVKLAAVGLALAVLIYFGYKKIEKKLKEKSQTSKTI
tara:strand:+ start:24 stop:611 length:588 start_codon:yes stop_codon:yes gene_type:complete